MSMLRLECMRGQTGVTCVQREAVFNCDEAATLQDFPVLPFLTTPHPAITRRVEQQTGSAPMVKGRVNSMRDCRHLLILPWHSMASCLST